MSPDRKTAIVAGILFIVAAVSGILSLPFSGTANEPDYLVKLAANQNKVIAGAILEVIMGFACASIAIFLYPVLKKYNEGLALGAVGFRIMEGLLFIVSAIGLVSLLSLSRGYINTEAPAAPHFLTLGALLLSGRFWTSQVFAAMAFCLGALMYYYIFYQSRLIPRWLSVWGLIAITMHLTAVVLTMFAIIAPFSVTQVTFALPTLLQEMTLAVWLIVKGFNPDAVKNDKIILCCD